MSSMVKQGLVFGAVVVLSACGGGSISGKVVNNFDGAPIASATVAVGTVSVSSAADGTFTLSDVGAGAGKVVSVTKAGFVPGSRIARVSAGSATDLDFALLPVASTVQFDPTQARTLTVAGSPAQVALGAGALRTASGGTPSGTATGTLTPIDPSSNPQIMPGNYSTSTGGLIESYGAIAADFVDGSGAPLNLASGQSATIRIPVAGAAAGSPPATMPAFFYNAVTGAWVQEGTLTLAGTAPDQYYTGTVTHFSTWNADQALTTACPTGKVVDAAGHAVEGARVEGQGRDYVGTSETYTAGDGTFTLLVKADSSVIVTALTNHALSQSKVVSSGAAGSTCTALGGDLVLGAELGSAGSGSAKVKLTWGQDPNDLDSHLTGPDGSGGRFHIYYSEQGSMTAAPFAALDVDDTSSFGPEVTTIAKFATGTYRYSVHHYAGTGTIAASPARVELTLNGATTVYTPPAPGSVSLDVDSVWQVFEISVSSGGSATLTTLGHYLTGVSAGSVQKPSAPGSGWEWGVLPRK